MVILEGVQLFKRGVQMPISIETHITCDFPGGFGPPIPPLDLHIIFCRNSKFSNTSCLSKRPLQTAQIQIRLLLKKQSDHGLPCLLHGKVFCEFQP